MLYRKTHSELSVKYAFSPKEGCCTDCKKCLDKLISRNVTVKVIIITCHDDKSVLYVVKEQFLSDETGMNIQEL